MPRIEKILITCLVALSTPAEKSRSPGGTPEKLARRRIDFGTVERGALVDEGDIAAMRVAAKLPRRCKGLRDSGGRSGASTSTPMPCSVCRSRETGGGRRDSCAMSP